MEFGTIEREIYVEASPEVVFEVVSSPEHVQQWWPDEARYEPVPGVDGRDRLRRARRRRDAWSPFTVVEAQPPRTLLVPLDPAGRRAGGGGQLAAGHLRPDPVRRRARC